MSENRTYNTLFLLISVDGKISTGMADERDFDKDLKNIDGIKEGLHQYYDLEKETDNVSLNTGRVMMKIGVHTKDNPIHCPNVTFVIIDNSHLNMDGLVNLCDNLKKLIIVTSNKSHPAFKCTKNNLEIVNYDSEEDFLNLFQILKERFKIERVTIQSGGTLNSVFIRNNLIDRVSLVVSPCLIGGKSTSTLVDGESLVTLDDLNKIKPLKLEKVERLDDSYIHIVYNF